MIVRLNGRSRGGTAQLSAQAESIRILGANLMVGLEETGARSVLVTSAQPNEGKTSVTANLAALLAATGTGVALVDLNFRHPGLHQWFQATNERGAADVLLGRRPVDECLQYVKVNLGGRVPFGLHLLATGADVESPMELLSASRTTALFDAVLQTPIANSHTGPVFPEILLIDAPPVLPFADALVIGRSVSAAVLVVAAGKTPLTAVEDAKDALARNHTDVLGVVLNGRSPAARDGRQPGESSRAGGSARLRGIRSS